MSPTSKGYDSEGVGMYLFCYFILLRNFNEKNEIFKRERMKPSIKVKTSEGVNSLGSS